MRFRLVTYNIHKGIGGTDRRYRLERIVETLRHCEPDFVLLQEVDDGVPRSNHHRQVKMLAEAVGLQHYAYQRNVRLKQGHYGNAILSRFSLSNICNIDLTIRFKKRRRALLAQCRVSSGRHRRTLSIVNVHLGLAGLERQIQLRKLLAHRSFIEAAGRSPTVIGGDYNDVWGTLGKRTLGSNGFKSVGKKILTFPAVLPMRPLDRIFYRDLALVHHAFASRTQIARQASDHLPLVADLEFVT